MASILETSSSRVNRSIIWGPLQTLLDFDKAHRIPLLVRRCRPSPERLKTGRNSASCGGLGGERIGRLTRTRACLFCAFGDRIAEVVRDAMADFVEIRTGLNSSSDHLLASR